ncbi:Beta-conglycinin, alpha' chain [Glycine soja]
MHNLRYTMMRARFPLLLLGVVFLASVSVSFGIAYWEKQNPSHNKCLRSCNSEKDSYRNQACHARCNLLKVEEEEECEEGQIPRPRPQHPERERQQHGEKEEDEGEQPRPFPFPRPRQPHQEEEHEQKEEHEWHRKEEKHGGKGSEEEQDEREHPRPHQPHQKEEEKHEWQHKQEKHQGKESEEEEEDQDEDEEQDKESQESEGSESQREPRRHKNKNPFHFNSKRFQTLFKNQYGHVRVLQRFNKRSQQLQNLRDYRILEFNSKPNTLLLPHHADADYLIVILNGTAILTLVNNDDRDSYNLQSGDALRVPAGTTYYVVNPDNDENLRMITLAIPVNKPGRFEDFFLSSTQDQQSYLQGFSENILEASFNTKFEEINRVLFGGEGRRHQQEGVILELSKEQIRELSKRAKSSSRSTNSFDYEPFYLRGSQISSNNFGKFYEITPEKNPQLRDFDILLNTVDINEGGLLLPHYNSKAIVILMVTEGEANIELVGLKEQQQGEETREVRKYRAELSEDDIFVIPAAYPFVVNATSNLNFVAFGINAENNQRNFLAGSKDNVIRQIQKQVKELAFPAGSAQDIENLIKNQRESYFADAQPLQKEEGKKGSFVF